MGQETVFVEKNEPVATIILNRPEQNNSADTDMLIRIAEALEKLGTDEATRVVVIRGAGQQAFCQGGDIGPPDNFGRFSKAMNKATDGLVQFDKPTIAMINGIAIGGGLLLALSCDLRIASESAVVGVPAARYGVVIGFKHTQRLASVVGVGRAREILFFGETYPASDAKTMGLVNWVSPQAELEAKTTEIATTLAGNAPLTIRAAKFFLNHIARGGTSSTLPPDFKTFIKGAMKSKDLAEGLTSVREGRSAEFKGE